MRIHMTTKVRRNILIVEDEQDVIDLLAIHFLRDTNYTISTANNGVAALEKARSQSPWIIILDLMLPQMSGLEVCKHLKGDRVTRDIPILMVSAKANEVDRIAGLELGADDYVTKPFSPRELLARVRAAIRRLNQSPEKREMFSFDDVEVNFSKMELLKSGKLVPLTPQEFKMLRFFLNNEERVVSRAELLNEVWGYNSYPTTRTVDTHILRLRQKLETDPGEPVHFRTVHGTGYKFVR